jgi:hypothetical protein
MHEVQFGHVLLARHGIVYILFYSGFTEKIHLIKNYILYILWAVNRTATTMPACRGMNTISTSLKRWVRPVSSYQSINKFLSNTENKDGLTELNKYLTDLRQSTIRKNKYNLK